MVYGRGPFGHLRDIAIKIAAISSPSTRISFPEVAYPLGKHGESIEEYKFFVGPDLLATLKSCLIFDPKKRASIPELLDQPFLRRTSGDCKLGALTRLKSCELIVRPNAAAARPDLPYISRDIMDAIVQRVSDKIRGPRNPLSELDLMDIAQVRPAFLSNFAAGSPFLTLHLRALRSSWAKCGTSKTRSIDELAAPLPLCAGHAPFRLDDSSAFPRRSRPNLRLSLLRRCRQFDSGSIHTCRFHPMYKLTSSRRPMYRVQDCGKAVYSVSSGLDAAPKTEG